MDRRPSGAQYEIRFGDQKATIVEVGAGIRTFTRGERDVVYPYSEYDMCYGASGSPLIPWPNRLADGLYEFDRTQHQLALTEPPTRTAIHGLLQWQSWTAVDRDAQRVVMNTRLNPQPGYPFLLDVSISYELGENGLVVSTTATNLGETACPYGAGQHPYLSPGEGALDDAVLEFKAGTRFLVDDRHLPCGTEDVKGTAVDFRDARPLFDVQLDHAFTDLERDAAGLARVSLAGTDGRTVRLWMDESYPFLQLYTGHTLSARHRRRALACEPMTCAPNAFVTGQGLVRLEPGAAFTSVWGVWLD
jgi:aldose 1-epimerase